MKLGQILGLILVWIWWVVVLITALYASYVNSNYLDFVISIPFILALWGFVTMFGIGMAQ